MRTGLLRLFWSTPMKIMPLFALASLLALFAHAHAEPVVDCGNFPNTQMRTSCWIEISRAENRVPGTATVAPAKPKAVTARSRKTIRED
jgi:hypothetical protein